jgi:hypothetical protein
MALPTYYYTARLAEPLIFLPQMGLVHLASEQGVAYFAHIRGMAGLIDHTIWAHDGDVDMGARFGGHWAVIRLHSGGPSDSTVAFTVWGHDWPNTLASIHWLQRVARIRIPGIKARRANRIAKLKAFKQQMRDSLPPDLIHLIMLICVTSEKAPAHKLGQVRRVETGSFRRLHANHGL